MRAISFSEQWDKLRVEKFQPGRKIHTARIANNPGTQKHYNRMKDKDVAFLLFGMHIGTVHVEEVVFKELRLLMMDEDFVKRDTHWDWTGQMFFDKSREWYAGHRDDWAGEDTVFGVLYGNVQDAFGRVNPFLTAVCNICQLDVADNRCWHVRGGVYAGQRCDYAPRYPKPCQECEGEKFANCPRNGAAKRRRDLCPKLLKHIYEGI